MSNKKYRFETLQLHVGQEQADPTTDARAVPIYQTTSYVFRNSQHAADRFALRDAGNIYGRLTNPTQEAFEKRMAALEGGVAALAVASGAAAVTYALQNVAVNGDHIIAANNLYGGTFNLIEHTLSTQGVTSTIVDPANFDEVEAAFRPNTKAIIVETFGNPNASVTNIDRISEIAHRHNTIVVVDNTFGTPYLFRPLEHGADVVVHSATRIRAVVLRDTGAAISPFNAWILLQGLETLSLRVERHVYNTLRIVEHLAHHPKVAKVNHPSLASHPDHELYNQYFPNGGGSIFTIELKGGEKEAWEFIDHLRIFSLLANVADVKSLVIHPATTTHSQMTPQELEEQHIYPSTIRLSIGIEHVDDLIDALDEALTYVK